MPGGSGDRAEHKRRLVKERMLAKKKKDAMRKKGQEMAKRHPKIAAAIAKGDDPAEFAKRYIGGGSKEADFKIDRFMEREAQKELNAQKKALGLEAAKTNPYIAKRIRQGKNPALFAHDSPNAPKWMSKTGNADRKEHQKQQWDKKQERKEVEKFVMEEAGWTDKDLGTKTERRGKKYRPGEVFKGVKHTIEGMPEYESAETVTTKRTLTNMGTETKEERNVKKDAGVAAKFAAFQKKMAARKKLKSMDEPDVDKAKLEREVAVNRKKKKGRQQTVLSQGRMSGGMTGVKVGLGG